MRLKLMFHRHFGKVYCWMPSHQRRWFWLDGRMTFPACRSKWFSRKWVKHDRKPYRNPFSSKGSIWNV